MSPILVRPDLTLPASDLSFRAVRASGPGGQNVNKVSSKVELRFDLGRSRALGDEVRERLRMLFPSRIDTEGVFLVTSQKTRDQLRNLEDACAKLRDMVLSALAVPRKRVKTKPSRAAKRRRLADKRHVSEKKTGRAVGGHAAGGHAE